MIHISIHIGNHPGDVLNPDPYILAITENTNLVECTATVQPTAVAYTVLNKEL